MEVVFQVAFSIQTDATTRKPNQYSELTKTSTALSRLAVTCVLSAARRLVLIFVNPL